MAVFKLLRQSPLSARIGLGMILLNVFAAIAAPVITPYSQTEVVGDVWAPKSLNNLLGTDHLGRDLLIFITQNYNGPDSCRTILTMSLSKFKLFSNANCR